MPTADQRQGRPLVMQFDVGPGVYRTITEPAAGEETVRYIVRLQQGDPSPTWNPTVNFAYLASQESDNHQSWHLNLSLDRTLNQVYARMRLFAVDGTVLSNRVHPRLFELGEDVPVELQRKGRVLEVRVAGDLVESTELPFDPKFTVLGGSSGRFLIQVVDDPDPPYEK